MRRGRGRALFDDSHESLQKPRSKTTEMAAELFKTTSDQHVFNAKPAKIAHRHSYSTARHFGHVLLTFADCLNGVQRQFLLLFANHR